MKKLLILSIALLVAVPSLQAYHAKSNKCSASKAKKHSIKKACVISAQAKACKTCKSKGKKPLQSKCHKSKKDTSGSGNIVKEAGDVVAAPFRWFTRDNEDHKSHKQHMIHDNDKDQIDIDQLEQDHDAEMNTYF